MNRKSDSDYHEGVMLISPVCLIGTREDDQIAWGKKKVSLETPLMRLMISQESNGKILKQGGPA